MKKLLALLLALVMVFCLAACGLGGVEDPDTNEDTPGASQTENQGGEENKNTEDTTGGNENVATGGEDEDIPTTGTPIGWPDNEYTKLVPTPNSGGKVLTSGEVGTLFAIELKWSMEQGLAYVQLLQDAGFGDDCVEKYEKLGTLDRTVNGVNVQMMDLFGVTSLSIMKVEE